MDVPITVVDHTDPAWSSRYTDRYVVRGRENGAATYSREIVEHHVPVWAQFVPPGTVLATCGPLTDPSAAAGAPLVVQYLHAYPYDRPLSVARQVARAHTTTLFVTAYRAQHHRLRAAGLQSVWVPMAVDVERVRGAAELPSRAPEPRRALYFGNVTKSKAALYGRLRDEFRAAGWRLDTLSDGTFAGEAVSQDGAWRIASGYGYGVAVGRCALELHALGLRVMVAGAEFGGLVTTDADWDVQVGCNFNGRTTTFDRDPAACLALFDQALVRPRSVPIEQATATLRGALLDLAARGWFAW